MTYLHTLLLLLACTFALAACTDDAIVEPDPNENKGTVVLVKDLPADPDKTGRYTFYRFSDSSIVANADSATGTWDIGINATSIIANTPKYGAGAGGAQLLDGTTFEAVTEAPATGYQDNLPSDWYQYTGPTGNPPHAILAKPGYVAVIRTSTGGYAKMRIISYYKGAPATVTGTEPARYYTFEYFYQPNGSTTLTAGM